MKGAYPQPCWKWGELSEAMRVGLPFKDQSTEWVVRDGEDATEAFAAMVGQSLNLLLAQSSKKVCSGFPASMESPRSTAF